MKKISFVSSLATMMMIVMTGVLGMVYAYYTAAAAFREGDRVAIPAGYYPLAAALVLALIVPFVIGFRQLWGDGHRKNALARCAVFCAALYFAASTISTPTQINRALERAERAEAR